jgi:hypothetical protein
MENCFKLFNYAQLCDIRRSLIHYSNFLKRNSVENIFINALIEMSNECMDEFHKKHQKENKIIELENEQKFLIEKSKEYTNKIIQLEQLIFELKNK